MTSQEYVAVLEELLKPCVVRQGNSIELTEHDKITKCPTITISSTGISAVLRVEQKHFPFFNDTVKGLNSSCDYIVLSALPDNKLGVLFCEMKSGNTSSAPKQMYASKIFFDFLTATVTRIKPETQGMQQILKGVIFSSGVPIMKGTTKARKSSLAKKQSSVYRGLEIFAMPCKGSKKLQDFFI